MKSWLMYCLFCGGLALLAIGASDLRYHDTALSSVGPEVRELGSVIIGQELPFQLRLINREVYAIHLMEVSSTCACAGVELPDRRIVGSNEVFFVAGRMKASRSAGPFSALVSITYAVEGADQTRSMQMRLSGVATDPLRVRCQSLEHGFTLFLENVIDQAIVADLAPASALLTFDQSLISVEPKSTYKLELVSQYRLKNSCNIQVPLTIRVDKLKLSYNKTLDLTFGAGQAQLVPDELVFGLGDGRRSNVSIEADSQIGNCVISSIALPNRQFSTSLRVGEKLPELFSVTYDNSDDSDVLTSGLVLIGFQDESDGDEEFLVLPVKWF